MVQVSHSIQRLNETNAPPIGAQDGNNPSGETETCPQAARPRTPDSHADGAPVCPVGGRGRMARAPTLGEAITVPSASRDPGVTHDVCTDHP